MPLYRTPVCSRHRETLGWRDPADVQTFRTPTGIWPGIRDTHVGSRLHVPSLERDRKNDTIVIHIAGSTVSLHVFRKILMFIRTRTVVCNRRNSSSNVCSKKLEPLIYSFSELSNSSHKPKHNTHVLSLQASLSLRHSCCQHEFDGCLHRWLSHTEQICTSARKRTDLNPNKQNKQKKTTTTHAHKSTCNRVQFHCLPALWHLLTEGTFGNGRRTRDDWVTDPRRQRAGVSRKILCRSRGLMTDRGAD